MKEANEKSRTPTDSEVAIGLLEKPRPESYYDFIVALFQFGDLPDKVLLLSISKARRRMEIIRTERGYDEANLYEEVAERSGGKYESYLLLFDTREQLASVTTPVLERMKATDPEDAQNLFETLNELLAL